MPPFAVLRSPRAFSPHKSAKKGKTPLHFRRTGDILSKLSLSGCGSVWSRALRSGRKSRRFKSSHPDHFFARVPLKNRPRYSTARMQDALAPGGLRFALSALLRLTIFPAAPRSARHSRRAGCRRVVPARLRRVAQSGLERCVRDAKVGGSNPLTPTTFFASSTVCDTTSYLL